MQRMGNHFDIHDSNDEPPVTPVQKPVRPHVGLHFACCNVYRYIYLQPNQSKIIGHCPKCMRRVQIEISPEGSTERILRVS
jgi:hypothetical protein